MCVHCNKPHGYTKDTLYKDMWYQWREDGMIHITCPNTADCVWPGEVLKVEAPNPKRFEIPFGKYAGKTLEDIKEDKWYLDFLHDEIFAKEPDEGKQDKRNALGAACIDVLLNRFEPEMYGD